MFNKLECHERLCNELHTMYVKKNHDYGDSVGKTYDDFGILSFATRISDKYNRFVSLAKGQNQMVNDESLIDTLKDMANYCLLAVVELEKDKVES